MVGRHHQAGAEIESPAHPAGVRLERAVGRVVELEDAEQPRRPILRRLAGHAAEPPDEDEVLTTGEVVVDRGELPGQADHRPDELRFLRRTSKPPTRGVAAVELQERGEDPDGGGLARAVRAEQAREHPFLDHEVDAVERGEVAEALDETLGDDTLHAAEGTRVARGRHHPVRAGAGDEAGT